MADIEVSPLPPFSAEELIAHGIVPAPIDSDVVNIEYTRDTGTTTDHTEIELTVGGTITSADTIIGYPYISGGLGYSQYHDCESCYRFSMSFAGLNSEEDFENVKEKFVAHFNEKHRDLLMKKGLPLPKKKFTKMKTNKAEGIMLTSLPTISSLWDQMISTDITTSAVWGTSFFHTMREQSRVPEYETVEDEEERTQIRNELRLHIANSYGVPFIPTVGEDSFTQEYNGRFYSDESPTTLTGSGARVPEYELAPRVNPRNMDRNSRFREMLSR